MLATAVAPWFTRRGIHYGWILLALTFLVALCNSAAFSLPAVLLLPMTAEFGWSRGDVGSAMGLMLLLFAAVAPFSGALILRFGLRRVVVASASVAVLALLGTTQVTARWQLSVSLGLMLGTAAGLVALSLSATVANRWFGARRGLAMGILTAAFAAGQLTFLPLAAWLATTYGWRVAVLPAILGCSLAAVLYLLFARDWPSDIGLAPVGETAIRPPPPPPAANPVTVSFGVLKEALPTRAFWVLAGTFFICGLSTSGLLGQHFIPFCADQGVGAVTAASALALMGVFNFLGTVGSGWLCDRLDNRRLLAWYYGLRGLSLIWLPFSDFDLFSLTLFAIFFGLDYVATVPPTVKLAAQHFGPVKAPIVFGWAFASHQAGGAVAAVAAGISRDATATYLPAFLAAGVFCLLAVVAVFGLRDIRATRPAAA